MLQLRVPVRLIELVVKVKTTGTLVSDVFLAIKTQIQTPTFLKLIHRWQSTPYSVTMRSRLRELSSRPVRNVQGQLFFLWVVECV